MSREYEKQEAMRMTHQHDPGNGGGDDNGQLTEPYINEIIPVDPSRTRRRPLETDSRSSHWARDYSKGFIALPDPEFAIPGEQLDFRSCPLLISRGVLLKYSPHEVILSGRLSPSWVMFQSHHNSGYSIGNPLTDVKFLHLFPATDFWDLGNRPIANFLQLPTE